MVPRWNEDVCWTWERIRHYPRGLTRWSQGSCVEDVSNSVVAIDPVPISPTTHLVVPIFFSCGLALGAHIRGELCRGTLSQYRRQAQNSLSCRHRPKAADGTPFSQSPAWGSDVERARARARVEGAAVVSWWWRASSMARERWCWRMGMSMSSNCCQSGRDAEEERSAGAWARWGDWRGGCPSMRPTRSANCAEEAMKAAGACREASRKCNPPRLLGIAMPLGLTILSKGPQLCPPGTPGWLSRNPWLHGECGRGDKFSEYRKFLGRIGMIVVMPSQVENLPCHTEPCLQLINQMDS